MFPDFCEFGAPSGKRFCMFVGVPGNFENQAKTLTGARFSHFRLPFFFQARFLGLNGLPICFKKLSTFSNFRALFGKPFECLWLENGGVPERGLKKSQKTSRAGNY